MPPFQFHKGTIKTFNAIYCVHFAVFDFNSIKVRLKPGDGADGEAADGNFNSIKVRLKLRISKSNEECRSHFNSIKVRLKQYEVIVKFAKQGFQFHKGTIKTFWLFIIQS